MRSPLAILLWICAVLLFGGPAGAVSAQSNISDKSMAEHGDGYDITLAYPELDPHGLQFFDAERRASVLA